jgi:hypothetical protein
MGIDAQVRGERARLECNPKLKKTIEDPEQTNYMLKHLGTEILMINLFSHRLECDDRVKKRNEMLQHAGSL